MAYGVNGQVVLVDPIVDLGQKLDNGLVRTVPLELPMTVQEHHLKRRKLVSIIAVCCIVFRIILILLFILVSYDIHIGDFPGVQSRACWNQDPLIGRYIPIGTYNSRLLYQMDDPSNSFPSIMFYDPTQQKWNFQSGSRTLLITNSMGEFNNDSPGLLFI